MGEKQQEKLEKLGGEIEKYAPKLTSHLNAFGTLEKGLADEHAQELGRLESEVRRLLQSWRLRKKTKSSDRYQRDVILPYFVSLLESLAARVEMARESRFKDSTTMYNLSLKAEALSFSDVEDVLEAYHAAVDEFLAAQKDAGDLEKHHIDSRNVLAYERTCNHAIYVLDQLASKIFKRKILTPANFDVKERTPHQFLGRISVGYEDFMPELMRVVAHEGPLGHNTHQLLSEGMCFGFNYQHTSEGLAILGEQLAIENQYDQDFKENRDLANLLKAKRKMQDSISAAFEKAAFHDRLSSDDIAKALESRVYQKEILTQRMASLDREREAHFSFTATPYFAGARLIRSIYDGAVARIRELSPDAKEYEENLSELLCRMFAGKRPARIVGNHVRDYLTDIEEKKQKGSE